MEHIIYVGVTLIVGVLIGWKTYPYLKDKLKLRKRKLF